MIDWKAIWRQRIERTCNHGNSACHVQHEG